MRKIISRTLIESSCRAAFISGNIREHRYDPFFYQKISPLLRPALTGIPPSPALGGRRGQGDEGLSTGSIWVIRAIRLISGSDNSGRGEGLGLPLSDMANSPPYPPREQGGRVVEAAEHSQSMQVMSIKGENHFLGKTGIPK